jgi:hypothetical protein
MRQQPISSIADLRIRLCLDEPKEKRPEESAVLDFKENLPDDIGKHVAAMANTFGGTIIIGISCEEVDSKKKSKRTVPIEIVGVHFPGGESKQYITNKILDTVRPRPSFDIKTITIGNTEKTVALITVTEGMAPPYEYASKADTSIPIRVQDSSRRANLSDLEVLFLKRANFQAPVEHVLAEKVIPTLWARDALGEYRSKNHLWITASPRTALPQRFDQMTDRGFRDVVRNTFGNLALNLNPSIRTVSVFQLEATTALNKNLNHRVWALANRGIIGHACSLTKITPLGSLAVILVRFFTMCSEFYSEKDYFGGITVRVQLLCPDITFEPKFPESLNSEDFDLVQGVNVPDTRQSFNTDESSLTMDSRQADLLSAEQIAEILLSLMRQTRGAVINFQRLEKSVENLISSPYSSRDD